MLLESHAIVGCLAVLPHATTAHFKKSATGVVTQELNE